MDERALLEAIGDLLDSKLEEKLDSKLEEKLAPITGRLDRLEQGQAKLVQNQVKLEQKQVDMQGRIESLTTNVANLNHSIKPQLKVIQEGVSGILEKYDRLEKLERTVEDQGHRIWALEQQSKAAQ